MAKEFKHFDKIFAELTGKGIVLCGYQDSTRLREIIRESCMLWPFKEHFTEKYTAEMIKFAVYDEPTAWDWQRFRVSLKGLTTPEKLFCLSWWWCRRVAGREMISDSSVNKYTEINKIRVNNYLGALKRGGQLDKDLRVVK